MARFYSACIGREKAGQHFEQRSFAASVIANHANLISAMHFERELLDHRLLVKALGDLFGFERLYEVLAQCGCASTETVQKTILDAVEEFSRGAGQADDLTLVVVRYRKSET